MAKRVGSFLAVDSEYTNRVKRRLQTFTMEDLYLHTSVDAAVYSVSPAGEVARCTAEPMTQAVLTVVLRRRWLHDLRTESGDDSWLLDYMTKDPELTLDWNLLENSLIEGEGDGT